MTVNGAKRPSRPNLFVVGMPRSGTTALSSYLQSHPDVFMAPKELHFFGSDLVTQAATRDPRGIAAAEGHRASLGLDSYLASFEGTQGRRYRCDSSVGYLYSTEAAQEIRAFAPDARILAHFRNPVDTLYSFHSLLFMIGLVPESDFEAALEQPYWWGGAASGFRWRFAPRTLVHYAEHLGRYFEVFGHDRVHVVLFDEFTADPPAAYARVLDFLGLEPDERQEFPVIHANRRPRSSALHRALHGSGPARRLARAVVADPARRRAIGRRLSELNRRSEPRRALDPSLRRRLEEEFAPEVRRLGALLGRDLTTLWATPPGFPGAVNGTRS